MKVKLTISIKVFLAENVKKIGCMVPFHFAENLWLPFLDSGSFHFISFHFLLFSSTITLLY